MPKKINPWIEHVKKTKKANPSLGFTEVLKKAGKSYKKPTTGRGIVKDVIKKAQSEPKAVSRMLKK